MYKHLNDIELELDAYSSGSLPRLINKYSLSWSGGYCANGWCLRVAERYLRMKKFTALSWNEWETMHTIISKHMREKHYISHHFSTHLSAIGIRYGEFWLNGRKLRLTEHQVAYISKLRMVANKLEKFIGDAS